MLSAVVAVLCKAKRLIILSDINGFYDSDPRLCPDAKLIEKILQIDETVYSLAGGAGSRRGTGGMKTKPKRRDWQQQMEQIQSLQMESTRKQSMRLSEAAKPVRCLSERRNNETLLFQVYSCAVAFRLERHCSKFYQYEQL